MRLAPARLATLLLASEASSRAAALAQPRWRLAALGSGVCAAARATQAAAAEAQLAAGPPGAAARRAAAEGGSCAAGAPRAQWAGRCEAVSGGVGSRGLSTMAAAAGSGNALLEQRALPRFDLFDAAQVGPAIEQLLGETEAAFSALEARAFGTTYESVVEAVEAVEAPLSFAWGLVGHLAAVQNSPELRAAQEAAQPAVVRTLQRLSQSPALYRALKALSAGGGAVDALDAVQRRIVDKAITGMELSGIGLASEAERAAFNQLGLRLAELSTKFSNNVLDSTKAFRLPLTDARDVAGLPETARALLAQNAVNDGAAHATAAAGPWTVTLDGPSYVAFLKYADRRELRRKVYLSYISRASEGPHDNAPLIEEILRLRKQQASMLGFACYADKSLSVKMAGSVDKVVELTTLVRERSLAPARAEMAELQAFAREREAAALAAGGLDEAVHLGPDGLRQWDVAYWSEKLKEERYKFTQEELRPYFSLDAVLAGLFQFAERVFGVQIVSADGRTPVWHKDVRFFTVLDKARQVEIASFFLDPYARPATKRPGAWMNTCQGRSRLLGRLPVAYLVCNGSPPTGDKPSLMTFSDVETLWHEMGHGLQHMLTEVPYADAAGISGVEWDAVELPSQFMEEWLYDRATVDSFAKHYQTGDKLPEELFSKLRASRHFMSGSAMLRQLNFGALDLALHSRDYDPAKIAPLQLQLQMAKDYAVLTPLPEDRFLCSFSHIFAGGYSAAYYSYLWARVMSSDAFAAFEEAGLDDAAAVAQLGQRYRSTVLALGGGTHPAHVFRAFRGRDPTPDALLRHSGLALASL